MKKKHPFLYVVLRRAIILILLLLILLRLFGLAGLLLGGSVGDLHALELGYEIGEVDLLEGFGHGDFNLGGLCAESKEALLGHLENLKGELVVGGTVLGAGIGHRFLHGLRGEDISFVLHEWRTFL